MIKVYYEYVDLKKNINIEELNENIRENVKKYNDKNSQKLSFYSWKLLNGILLEEYKIDLAHTKIYFNKYNKPYIKEIYFNISHSENIIAIAISDFEVGIDIEKEENLQKHLDSKYYETWLSTQELEEFKRSKNQLEFITKSWSMKEAVLKQKGIGIQVNNLKNVHEKVNTIKINNKEKYYLSVINSKNEIVNKLQENF